MKSPNKELQKPFVFGQAIGDNHFIGREREQQRLAANFAHGINTILMAPRRWGKTSLVKRTMAEIQSDNIKVVYIDAYFCRNEYEFYNHFAESILHQTNSKFEQWTETAAELYIKMDEEFFRLLKVLPVSADYLPTVLDYYESHDAKSLTAKLSSIQGFKGITSPMKQVENGWLPDFDSRYFTEDFPYGLKYIWQLAHENDIECPYIDKVYEWGMSKVKK